MTVAEPAGAARLAGLPLEATVALADVAGSIKDGLLPFASATGLVVMHQLLAAELAARIGPKHARIPVRRGDWLGSTRLRLQWSQNGWYCIQYHLLRRHEAHELSDACRGSSLEGHDSCPGADLVGDEFAVHERPAETGIVRLPRQKDA